MVAGGGFALAGLWLMFRPKPEGGAAKLELFGAKFEASSAGLLVFLIGAGFLAAPLFVPERNTAAGAAGTAATTGPNRLVVPTAAGELPVRKRAEAREVERNDSFDTANLLEVGASVAGTTEGGEDWYILPVTKDKTALYLKVRNNDGACFVDVYSSDERHLLGFVVSRENTVESREITLPGSAAILLKFGSNACVYEIFSSYNVID
jgi:hypothetical protein